MKTNINRDNDHNVRIEMFELTSELEKLIDRYQLRYELLNVGHIPYGLDEGEIKQKWFAVFVRKS